MSFWPLFNEMSLLTNILLVKLALDIIKKTYSKYTNSCSHQIQEGIQCVFWGEWLVRMSAVTVVFVAVTDSHAVRLLQTEWMTSFKNRRGKRHVFDYTGLKCLYMQVFLSNNMSHMKAFTAFVVQS